MRISKVRKSQKVKGATMLDLQGTIFYLKTNLLQDFHTCTSVPLICFQLVNKLSFIFK